MTQKEFERGQTLLLVKTGKLTRSEAAERLGITVRQVDRLRHKLCTTGSIGLAHGNRGRKSNNSLSEDRRQQVLALVKEHYYDFGPTFAAEKLLQKHLIKISKEKLRQLMKEEGLWKARKRKGRKCHPRRARRSCYGDMLQGDGSHHDWFEGRRAKCVLVALIDDATNKAYGLFFEGETTAAYVEVVRKYLSKKGCPLALYVDKDSIFRVNTSADRKTGETQFARMMQELDIRLICAHSPEAKGRVERLFGTLQDRLVKEMRLLNITTIEEANEYLEKKFWNEYNARWSHTPAKLEDLHRKAPSECIMDRIFTLQYQRKTSKSLDFSYQGTLYQIQSKTPHRIAQRRIKIFESFDGTFWVECEGEKLTVKPIKDMPRAAPIEDAKTINAFLNKRKALTAIEKHRRGIACPR
jgi:transposase